MGFNPNAVYVQYRPDIHHFTPYLERKYTLTHSDETAQLFLTVSKQFAYDTLNPERDEVFATWIPNYEGVVFQGSVFVGDESIPRQRQFRRYTIFHKEMETALRSIFYGERWLLQAYPFLLYSPIHIQFNSNLPYYHQNLFFGYVYQYV
ncbi:hypothetical protein N781_14665 [Pontibacillus halophilus JSM 076056 = DSM 19796]|uniref:Staygreen protein domain-containing protein n=1 Tax=Pontibacillus halophilus JSM 076056 = DSM 19796 TaxID=1385510 RepID=A0A0A5GMX7_9BACI|nr:staygreen family protein [Pontibacillus halophilus]KGX92573.1 hypothetical protein N781_14665 [Pontibacillus halophilus JSM 076056 = DSM 19796]